MNGAHNAKHLIRIIHECVYLPFRFFFFSFSLFLSSLFWWFCCHWQYVYFNIRFSLPYMLAMSQLIWTNVFGANRFEMFITIYYPVSLMWVSSICIVSHTHSKRTIKIKKQTFQEWKIEECIRWFISSAFDRILNRMETTIFCHIEIRHF